MREHYNNPDLFKLVAHIRLIDIFLTLDLKQNNVVFVLT